MDKADVGIKEVYGLRYRKIKDQTVRMKKIVEQEVVVDLTDISLLHSLFTIARLYLSLAVLHSIQYVIKCIV